MLSVEPRICTNWNLRPKDAEISAIVIHDTGSKSLDGVWEHFCDPTSQASAHFGIGREPSVEDSRFAKVYEYVPVKYRAWHAGKSALWQVDDLNNVSIGIELVDNADDPYPPVQLASLFELCTMLCRAYPAIWLNRIVGHEHIALPKGRKVDPGRDFPWRQFLIDLGAALR